MPGRELLERYSFIEKVQTQETEVPPDLREGIICLGESTYKGHKQLAYLSTDFDYQFLSLVIIGPNRAGKSKFLANLSTTDASVTPSLDDVTVTVTSAYKITGNRVAPTLDLSAVGVVETSAISWAETLNGQTITVETNLSLDNGATWQGWQPATNGGSIPGLAKGTDVSQGLLQVRQTLSTADVAVTPAMHSLTVQVLGGHEWFGYRESPAFGISGECRITWEVTLNGQILAIQSNISRDGGTTWEGWQDCVNGGIIPGTDTGNLSNAKLNDIMKSQETLTKLVNQTINKVNDMDAARSSRRQAFKDSKEIILLVIAVAGWLLTLIGFFLK